MAVLFRDRRVLIPTFLIVSAAYVTLYTMAAHDLARWGWACRGTLGDATFLPFPTGPRGVLMDVVAKMSPADEFIYTYLIKTGALVGVSLLLWILAAAYLLKAVLPLFWKSSSHIPVNLLCFRAPDMPRVRAGAPLSSRCPLGLLGRTSSELELILDDTGASIFFVVKGRNYVLI